MARGTRSPSTASATNGTITTCRVAEHRGEARADVAGVSADDEVDGDKTPASAELPLARGASAVAAVFPPGQRREHGSA